MIHFRIKMLSASGEFYLDVFADTAEQAQQLVTVDWYDAVFISAYGVVL